MKDSQFEALMKKLEEIRCGVIDVETGTENIASKVDHDAIKEAELRWFDTEAEALLIKEEHTVMEAAVSLAKVTLTNNIRQAFFHQLEAKTGWGRNEVKQLFENAVDSAS